MVCQSQQVGVSELSVALQAGLHSFHGRRNLKAVGPEVVSWMDEILAEQRECFDGREGISRECRIRGDSYESELGQRAGRPSSICPTAEPAVRSLVVFVRRPEQR